MVWIDDDDDDGWSCVIVVGMDQCKQFQELKNQTGFLNDSLVKLTSKVDSIATHTKMLETQISQVAQQVAISSQTPGVFPSQTETNPKYHCYYS